MGSHQLWASQGEAAHREQAEDSSSRAVKAAAVLKLKGFVSDRVRAVSLECTKAGDGDVK